VEDPESMAKCPGFEVVKGSAGMLAALVNWEQLVRSTYDSPVRQCPAIDVARLCCPRNRLDVRWRRLADVFCIFPTHGWLE
jgi:hypothetical protein